MKTFNNIQELWDYCLFCPICRENCRDIKVSVGPDMVFIMNSHEKTETMLNFCCNYKSESYTYTVDYKINCIDNTFIMTVPVAKPNNETYLKASEEYFYFYIQGICKNCNSTAAYGNDLELNVLTKKVTNIKLDLEAFSFYTGTYSNMFSLEIDHIENVIWVACLPGDGKYTQLPLFELDFIDQNRTVEKIKTYILFS